VVLILYMIFLVALAVGLIFGIKAAFGLSTLAAAVIGLAIFMTVFMWFMYFRK
jgi:hypothetical protein